MNPREPAIKEIIVKNIFESMPIGVLVIQPGGSIFQCNQAAGDILGYDPQGLTGRGWGEVFFNDDRNDDFNQVLVDVIWQQRVNLHRKVSYFPPEGPERKLSVNSSFLSEHQDLAGIVVLLSDETELFEIRRREKEALEAKTLLQIERTESLKKLALAVAHEIRNPIMVIGGFARRLRDSPNGLSSTAKYLDQILSGVHRLENIVRSVKDYAEIPGAEFQTVLVSEVVDTAFGLARQKARETQKTVDFQLAPGFSRVRADPILLARALAEVMVNSIESFRKERGLILLSTREEEEFVVIEVVDDGAGISEKDMPFVFDLFFSTKAESVGMGLAKVQRILSEHRGRILLESAAGRGTRVQLYVPLVPWHPADPG